MDLIITRPGGSKPPMITIDMNKIPAQFVLCQAEYPEDTPFPENDYEAYSQWATIQYQIKQDYRDAGIDLERFVSETANTLLVCDDDENAVYSPVLLYISLAALTEFVTNEDTQKDLFALLQVDSMEELRQKVSILWKGVYADNGAYTCIFANSFWLDDEFDFDRTILE